MANDCGFGEFLGVEVEEEDGVELSLGLSIGGSFRKAEKLKPIKQKRVCSSSLNDVKSCEIDADFGEIDRSFCKSDVSSIFNEGKEGNDGVEVLDPQRKKEIHALRRQEARKKREEKRHKKGICNGGIPMRTGSIDDKTMFEAQMLQIRVRDREVKVDEANRCERIFKKDRSDNDGSNKERQNTDMSLKDDKTLNRNPDSNPSVFSSSSTFSVVPMHYSYVPFSNGFAYPHIMPCLAPPAAAAIVDNDKNVFQPVACRGFRPFQLQNPNGSWHTSSDLEPNGSGGGGRVEQAQSSRASSGSTGSSSSAVSDHQSTSLQGGSSSDSRSHSINDQPQLHTSVASNAQGQFEHSASSHPGGSSTQSVQEAAHNADKVVSTNTAQSSAKKPEKSISVTESIPIKKSISTTDNPSSQPTHPLKEAKGDRNKPPRPQPQQQPQTPSLPQMLRVSTTGNGPNGKTITGFLYRYTKTEVTIMCVCHGSSFSPAEFVEHAGGTDISHPLRQIVIRSASG